MSRPWTISLLLLIGCSYSPRPSGDLESVCIDCCNVVTLAGGETCEKCHDSEGTVTGTNCPAGCGLCVNPTCGPNERLVSLSGQCCPICVPANDCGGATCVIVDSIDCPSGQHVERDATDCCKQVCVFDACTGSCSAAEAAQCPAHYRLDPTAPPCCSVCVPDGSGGCDGNEDCDASSECVAGVCETPAGVTCPALDKPDPTACPGYWRVDADAQGCPLPPLCICPDLYPATNSTFCADHCALEPIICILDLFCDNGDTVTRNTCNPCCPQPNAVCSPPPLACDADSDCTNQPISGSTCIGGYCGKRLSGLDGLGVTYNGETACIQANCRPDQVIDFGSGCCPICRDTCSTSADCTVTQTCSRHALSTCAVEACHLPDGACDDMTGCFGVCQ